MTIFLTVFFGISAFGHAMEYTRSGKMIHMGMFILTVLVALWHMASVIQ
jgi:hypothetical protein